MSKREYASAKAIAKQLKGKTENKPEMSNTKKTESFKYRIYKLNLGLLRTQIKIPGGKG